MKCFYNHRARSQKSGFDCVSEHLFLNDDAGEPAYRKNSKIWYTSNNCHNCPKKIEKFDVTLH